MLFQNKGNSMKVNDSGTSVLKQIITKGLTAVEVHSLSFRKVPCTQRFLKKSEMNDNRLCLLCFS